MISKQEFCAQWKEAFAGLKNFALKHTQNNHDDAKDLLQEVFLKAYQNRDKFDVGTSFKTWIYSVTKNKFIDDFRKKKIRSNINHHFSSTEGEMKFSSCAYNNGSIHIFQEAFEAAINKLDSRLREPFLLHVQGYPYEEIADKCKSPLGTVKNRIFHARKELQKLLHDYRPENFKLSPEEITSEPY